ncbi:MAG: hypothetical protein N2254_08570 [bacterium]|nr:hypothetical protein [bacterium]
MLPKFWKLTILFFVLLSCSSNSEEEQNTSNSSEIDCQETTPTIEKQVTLTPDRIWVDTGIKLKRGDDVIIEANSERAYGKTDVDFSNPVLFSGSEAIIYKIGEDGIAQPVGKQAKFTAGKDVENENLYIGWNSSKPLVKILKDEEGREKLEKPEPITVVVKVFPSQSNLAVRRVPLYAPVQNFWTDETNPRFYWEPFDNAVRYIFQISDYPDFRRVIQNIEIQASGGQANPVSVIGGGDSQNVQFNLQEGIYWWRVRAQVNLGRPLNPVLTWTCWSHPYRLGVELGTPPAPPEFLSPTTLDVFKPGDTVKFEFTVEDDPSFVFWRIRHVFSECDQQPSINPNDPNSGNPTPWNIFRQKLGEGNIVQIPGLIASYTYKNIETGNHLFRVEVRDGASELEINIRSSDIRFSVGCEKPQETQQGNQNNNQGNVQGGFQGGTGNQ